jgi:hypothetical protein
MALDTREKRASALMEGILPVADGTVSSADLGQTIGLYRASWPSGVFTISYSGTPIVDGETTPIDFGDPDVHIDVQDTSGFVGWLFEPNIPSITDQYSAISYGNQTDSGEVVDLVRQLANTKAEFSVSMWIKFSFVTNSANKNVFYSTYDDFDGWGMCLRLSYISTSTAYVKIAGRSRSSDSLQEATGTVVLTKETWYHVVGIWDFANAKMVTYIDAVKDVDSSATWGDTVYDVPTASTYPDNFGNDLNAAFEGYNNGLDDIRLYDHRLTQQEATDLYGGGHVVDGSSQSISQTLSFVQTISSNGIWVESVEHYLDFEQAISLNSGGQGVAHTLVFAQDIGYEIVRSRSIVHTLDYQQHIDLDIDYASGDFMRTVRHTLDFVQSIDVARACSVEHTLEFTQHIRHNIINKSIIHVLTFDQTIGHTGASDPYAVQHTLDFVQSIGLNVDLGLSVAHTLNFTQSILAYVESTCERFRWLDGPTLVPVNTFIVSYGGDTVTLPAPMLTNRESLDKYRISRKTRGGDLKLLVDSTWPDVHVWSMRFEDLDVTLKDEFVAFLKSSLGQVVTITDHESRGWTGIILNPGGLVTTVRPTCGFAVSLDIQILSGPT